MRITTYRCYLGVVAAGFSLAVAGRGFAGDSSAVTIAALINQYEADRGDVATYYDLPGSDVRFDRLESLYAGWNARLKSVAFEPLSQSEKIDYLLLRNDLDDAKDDLKSERKHWCEMEPMLPFHAGILSLEQARWKELPLDSPAAAAVLAGIVKQVRDTRERLERGLKSGTNVTATITHSTSSSVTGLPLVVSTPLAKRSAEATERLRSILKRWFAFHDGYRPDFSWWVKKPYEEADKALEDYARYLREQVAGLKGKEDDPLIGEPAGEAELNRAIRREFLPYDARDLLAIGQREMIWCERELKAAARDMGCGDDWHAALAKVKADYVAPGNQDSLISAHAREAIAFVKKHRLATIPPLCEESWHLTMSSPETLKTIPYVAYNWQNMMVAYAREDMNLEDKLMTMRGNNRHFARTVTLHELIPGHHLQRFAAARHNPQRARFGTPFLIEGWAFYWERRFWDLGWARTPEDRMGMLFWRMTRAARIEVSLKFHLGEMTPAQMVDFLVDRVGHERMGATSEVRRFIGGEFSPLYQASYMIGALQIDALRKALVDGGTLTEAQFSDTILAENAIPVELMRAELLNLPLTRDTQSTWRFADPFASRRPDQHGQLNPEETITKKFPYAVSGTD